jgi:hypothetical protein
MGEIVGWWYVAEPTQQDSTLAREMVCLCLQSQGLQYYQFASRFDYLHLGFAIFYHIC